MREINVEDILGGNMGRKTRMGGDMGRMYGEEKMGGDMGRSWVEDMVRRHRKETWRVDMGQIRVEEMGSRDGEEKKEGARPGFAEPRRDCNGSRPSESSLALKIRTTIWFIVYIFQTNLTRVTLSSFYYMWIIILVKMKNKVLVNI